MRTALAVACALVACWYSTLAAQNPVATALRGTAARAQRNIVEAAEAMPADKYGYKPTPAQMSFGEVVLHLAGGNSILCGSIAGQAPPPEGPKLRPTDAKDKLVDRLKASFTFCTAALAQLEDTKLVDSIPFFGGRKVTRASATLDIVEDWADHYSQMAIYLRLNGVLPPTAKRREM